jgi:mono/diheme cytochrome c family protein
MALLFTQLYRLVQAACLAAVLLLASACDFRTEKAIAGDRTHTHIDTRQISFQYVYDHVFAPKCCHCHGSSGGVSLETYEDVVYHLARIKERVLVLRDMPKPPNPGLDTSEADLLQAWILAGAPRDPINPQPSPSPDPSPSPTPSPEPSWEPIVSTFEGIHARVFEPRCSSCHNPDGHTDFDTEQNLIELGLIVPGDPAKSEIYRRIRVPMSDPDHMPPDTVLGHEELTAIHAWILHVKPPTGGSP